MVPSYLTIAGVRFIIWGLYQPLTGTAIQPFQKNSQKDSSDIIINIQIQKGVLPDTKNYQQVFHSPGFWTIYDNGDDFMIDQLSGQHRLWVARINREFNRIVIYCKNMETVNLISHRFHYPLGQLILIHILSRNNGALIHAAGMDIKGNGYIFPGKSGAGKSTLVRQLIAVSPLKPLNDDRMAVRKMNNEFITYGTPWSGEAGIAENANVLLKSIFFISHGISNRIISLKPKNALERLFPVISIPWYDKEIVPPMLDFCENLVTSVPCYELQFKPNAEIVEVIEKFANG